MFKKTGWGQQVEYPLEGIVSFTISDNGIALGYSVLPSKTSRDIRFCMNHDVGPGLAKISGMLFPCHRVGFSLHCISDIHPKRAV